MKYPIVFSLLLSVSMLSAQSIIKADGTTESHSTPRVVTPGVLNLDRFKANVPSLVVKANPLTIPFKYIMLV